MKEYLINEIFYSLQGEGVRAGEPSIFLRFAKCDLNCWFCDTDFENGVKMSASEIVLALKKLSKSCQWVICTGGEPALQLDENLINVLHDAGFKIAIETNGRTMLPSGIDYIVCSPKTKSSDIKITKADELKYVIKSGDRLPKPPFRAKSQIISPMFDPDSTSVTNENLQYCIDLVKENPEWRLSVQQHKIWGVR